MAKHTAKSNRKPTSSKSRKSRLRQKQASPLDFETLEPKQLLAGVTVGNALDVVNAPDLSSISALVANDGGDGISLREAISASNNTSGADTITFEASLTSGGAATINVGSQLPTISDALTIAGPGANLLTLDAGNGTDNQFNTQDGFSIFRFDDGALLNRINGNLSGLTLTGGDSGASGGAIHNRENLTITRSTISGNSSRRDHCRKL